MGDCPTGRQGRPGTAAPSLCHDRELPGLLHAVGTVPGLEPIRTLLDQLSRLQRGAASGRRHSRLNLILVQSSIRWQHTGMLICIFLVIVTSKLQHRRLHGPKAPHVLDRKLRTAGREAVGPAAQDREATARPGPRAAPDSCVWYMKTRGPLRKGLDPSSPPASRAARAERWAGAHAIHVLRCLVQGARTPESASQSLRQVTGSRSLASAQPGPGGAGYGCLLGFVAPLQATRTPFSQDSRQAAHSSSARGHTGCCHRLWDNRDRLLANQRQGVSQVTQ